MLAAWSMHDATDVFVALHRPSGGGIAQAFAKSGETSDVRAMGTLDGYDAMNS